MRAGLSSLSLYLHTLHCVAAAPLRPLWRPPAVHSMVQELALAHYSIASSICSCFRYQGKNRDCLVILDFCKFNSWNQIQMKRLIYITVMPEGG
ncbi:uncharacterized protein BDV17DRAFT_55351 [Aspergillus undulatus]|uniref:uncharacterized protein n=1 Tax=Aspergillus undulatus TaxID=1810928 RepID=UPI003CCDCAB0